MTNEENPVAFDIPALLSPERCAVVVVDLQNDFCHPDGAIARMGQDTTAARSIVPHVRELVDEAHSADVPVIYLRVTDSEWSDTDAWFRRGLAGDVLDIAGTPLVREGTWGAQFFGVEPTPADLVITKHRYSGFAFTPLELALRAKRAETVLLAGAQTDVCVQYTAADAVSRGFTPAVVRECVASGGEERNLAALASFAAHLGPVVRSDEVTRAWKG